MIQASTLDFVALPCKSLIINILLAICNGNFLIKKTQVFNNFIMKNFPPQKGSIAKNFFYF